MAAPPSASNKRKFHCPDCGESFDRKHDREAHLRDHRAIHHDSQTESTSATNSRAPHDESNSNQAIDGEVLGKDFENMDSIDSMLRDIQNNANQRLDNKEVEFSAKDPASTNLTSQLADAYLESIEAVISKVNRLICLECGRQFQRYMSYKQHWGN